MRGVRENFTLNTKGGTRDGARKEGGGEGVMKERRRGGVSEEGKSEG